MVSIKVLVFLVSAVSFTAEAYVVCKEEHGKCEGMHASQHLELMESQKHEVWMLDQADTDENGGGMLYVYDNDALDRQPDASPSVIDLAAAARKASCPVAKRPHMMSAFNHYNSMDYVVISYVASGDIQVLDTRTKEIVACLRTVRNGSLGGSLQNHYAEFTLDGRYIIVVDIGGKVNNTLQSGYLHTVKFDCPEASKCELTLIHSLSLHDYTDQLQTPLARPICGGFDPRCDCHYFYLTLAQGGLIIANFTGNSMKVIRVYGKDVVHGNGCGGVRRFKHRFSLVTNSASTGKANAGDYLYLWDTVSACSSGVWHDPIEMKLDKYNRDMEGDATYDSTPYGNVPLGDTHGIATCVAKNSGREILMSFMRLSNEVIFVDPYLRTVVGRKSLASHTFAPNPTPDIATLLTQGGGRICFAMRGEYPLSAIKTFVDVARTPGFMCIHMTDDCLDFNFTEKDFYPTEKRLMVDNKSDPHSIYLVVYDHPEDNFDVPE